MQWLVALLSLIGALFGGVFSSIVSNRLSERRADLELIREARIALERWDAARSDPNDIKYPDVDESILKTIEDRLIVIFFDRYFEESYKTKVALGVVRHWDSRIADILDGSGWRIPERRTICGLLSRMRRCGRKNGVLNSGLTRKIHGLASIGVMTR